MLLGWSWRRHPRLGGRRLPRRLPHSIERGGLLVGGSTTLAARGGIGGIRLPRAAADPAAQSAPQLLVRLARQHPGALRVLATGPLTNLALALQLEPRLPDLVAEVTIMGGAALVPGNVTPVAEANIINDPEAAAAVFAVPWPIVMVPLDVTMDHVLTERQRGQLRKYQRRASRQFLG